MNLDKLGLRRPTILNLEKHVKTSTNLDELGSRVDVDAWKILDELSKICMKLNELRVI